LLAAEKILDNRLNDSKMPPNESIIKGNLLPLYIPKREYTRTKWEDDLLDSIQKRKRAGILILLDASERQAVADIWRRKPYYNKLTQRRDSNLVGACIRDL